MDGGQRRTETGCRVEPAAVRLAGGERSAQHRFPRGAAGIDKGSAAAPLIPFTAPVRKIFRHTPGERNHSTVVTHCRMARNRLSGLHGSSSFVIVGRIRRSRHPAVYAAARLPDARYTLIRPTPFQRLHSLTPYPADDLVPLYSVYT